MTNLLSIFFAKVVFFHYMWLFLGTFVVYQLAKVGASLFDLFDGIVKVFGATGLAKELFEQAHADVGDSLRC